ncbi:MAG: T9SS type A sorting domain-containing protein [Bacteroidetes bacterium]|nr:T9SS type A sorting domain-containing protein [Bacteroidota bacterium]
MHKKPFSRLLFVTIMLTVILLSVISLNAQTTDKEYFQKHLKRSLKEKIKFTPEQIIELNNKDKQTNSGFNTKRIMQWQDSPISGGAENESEVHAAINPFDTNNIVVSPIQNSGTGLSCPVYYTKNFGSSWSKSSFQNMPSEPGGLTIGGGDPVFAFGKDSIVYMTWIDLYIKNMSYADGHWGLFYAYSNDGGANWLTSPNNIVSKVEGNLNTFQFNGPLVDKQWMAVDMTNGQHQNTIYVCYVEINATNNTYNIVVNKKASDSTQFLVNSVNVSGVGFSMVQFSSIGVDNNGNVHISFFGAKSQGNYALWHSKSTDGGNSFSTPQKVSDIQLPQYSYGQTNLSILGIDDDRLYPSSYIAVDKTNGNLYLTWTANGISQKLNKGLDVYFTKSVDHGSSWSTPIVVNDDTLSEIHQFYSAITVSDDHRVCISWYDRRSDTNNVITDYYLAESNDFGQTFTKNHQVTTIGSDFSKIGNLNNGFGIGEYTQVLATNTYTIPIWSDGRKNTGDVDIFVAFINKNTQNIEQITAITEKFALQKVYPNPTKDDLTFSFYLKEKSNVKISIFNVLGQRIQDVENINFDSGEHSVKANVSSNKSGIYYYLFETEFGNASGMIIKE